MEIIKTKIKSVTHWNYFPILVFTFFILIMHFFLSPSGDDITYGTIFYKEPVLTFISQSYYEWSSRIIIMPIAAFFAGNSFFLFSIFDVFVYFLLAFMISKLFVYDNQRKMNWIIVLLLACVPFVSMLTTAGWVVTSIHYFWPLTLSLVALYPLKKILFNEAIKWYEYPVYFIATVFGMNMEIMAAILVSFYFIFCIFFIAQKNISRYTIFTTIVLIGNLIFILLCPGNTVRDIAEIASQFPEYASFGLLQKMTLSATSFIVTIDQNFIMLTVLGLAWLYSWKKYQTGVPRIMGILPFVICALIDMARVVVLSPKFACGYKLLTGNNITDWISFQGITSGTLGVYHYLVLAAMTIFVISLMAMTITLFKDSQKLWIAVLVMGAGIMSRVAMGFSPTVYKSGARTFLFQYIAMAILGLLIYQEFNSSLSPKNQKRVIWGLALLAICGYLESLCKLC
ncbi:hypothetical protein GH810_13255 [Acetobacterium paludosum]|uniref:Uncharacterized protein n=1 Tax=Acetobacterium paludosum TaxID=52693 RepID=A0A923KTC8_9FIRM|nr:DUF6056 family protein [Acetobacterium paludosum]MBC3889282.1 hypothetical protein [Acetobacterium paludosum]